MSGRHTNIMKVHILVPFAVVSLLLAIPLTTPTVKGNHFIKVAKKDTIVLASKTVVNKPTAPTTPTPAAKPATPAPAAAAPTPVVTPAPAPQVVTASYTCQNYASDFDQYSWNPSVAMAICQAESSGNPNAISNASINPDGISDYGLMQLHGIDILDPAANIAYAYYHKYLTQGWGAWSTYNSGAYYKYL